MGRIGLGAIRQTNLDGPFSHHRRQGRGKTALVRVGGRLAQFGDNLAPVGNEDLLALLDRLEVFTQAVLEFSNADGSHPAIVPT